MQEKKNKQLLILFLVLTGITVGFYGWTVKRDHKEVDLNVFRNFDLKSVDQVLLKSDSGEVDLRLDGVQWKVNQTYLADRDMIDVLFATLEKSEPKRPLSGPQRDSIGHLVEENGIHVTALSNGEVVLDIFCGGNAQKTQAYFKKAGDEEVYLMNIPGYRVYVSGIFELPQSGWRDKYVFGFNWRNFKSLEAQFEDTRKNFMVQMDDSYFGIAGLEAVDTTRLNDYLDAVSLLTVDDYLQDSSRLAGLKSQRPLLNLIVKDIANREYSLQIYSDQQKGNFFGYLNGKEWARISRNKLMAISHSREFFVRQ
ncbi:MAG TPA: DUF4340 domain-containing protein [Ohtaekwangia sp.]